MHSQQLGLPNKVWQGAAADLMAEGDLVILFAGRDRVNCITLQQNATFRNKFGDFPHNNIIGKQYGSKIQSTNKKTTGFVFALKPSPELWAAGAIEHRTQIIYSLDASVIVFYLELRPGSVVIESGTGSGSLSRAIARTIAPNGHLYTFEFHEQRAKGATEDFKRENLSDVITVQWRDVCQNGFAIEGKADAVFLDLPSPWEAIGSATTALKKGGNICAYTPCIEQAQRVCDSLRERRYTDLHTLEVRLRPYSCRMSTVRKVNYNTLNTAEAQVSGIGESTPSTGEKEDSKQADEEEEEEVPTRGDDMELGDEADKGEEDTAEKKKQGKRKREGNNRKSNKPRLSFTTEQVLLTQPVPDIRGHTSFLTFAKKPVS